MHWADIFAAIRKSGMTLSGIAKEEAVSVTTVSSVVKGEKTSHRIAYAIAAKTGIPTEKLWPGKYLTQGNYQQARRGHSTGRLPEQKGLANG